MIGSAPIAVDELEAALAQVRPLILGHGGDIEILSIGEDGVVSVRLAGACKACPNMAMTYVGPIRTCLMQVAGVTGVQCRQVRASTATLDRAARLMGAQRFAELASTTD
jgi:Fe-S cluster biogenesis protein NfuA